MAVVEQTDEIELKEGEELTSIDKELEQTQQEDLIPDKFKNKSAEEIIAAYTNLEKEYGRRSNEIGELRKLTDNLLGLKLEKEEKEEPPAKKKITTDDLFNDPDNAISQAILDNPRLSALEKKFIEQERESNRRVFENQHKDWQEVMGSEGFQTWIKESPIRTRMLVEADQNFDYQTGAELLSLYKELKQVKSQVRESEVKDNRDKTLKAMTTEKGSSGESSRKIFSRIELLRLRQVDPDKFDMMQDEIIKAYREGRVK